MISICTAIEEDLRQSSRKTQDNNTIYTFENIVGECDKMREAKELAKQIAGLDTPVLLWGESGTGKEVFAQAIHNESGRSGEPFIGINCGAIPRELIESELFGYDGGSFTGARKEGGIGKLEAANGGTLFFDEVESMPLDVQIKLLRVLSTIPIDIRIISATKKDLYIESEQGRFREDLYYRINTIALRIPPLRDRGGDIRMLADFYISKVKKNIGITELMIPGDFYEMLDNYDWKGNVRELRNIIEGAVSLSKNGGVLNTSMLPDRMTGRNKDIEQTLSDAEKGRNKRLKEIEVDVIRNAIEFTNGNLSAAAKALGIARSTLYKKIKENQELSGYISK